MKKIHFLLFFSLLGYSMLRAQQVANYPVEIGPLSISEIGVNLSARIVAQNHYVITLTLQTDDSKKKEKTVRPFDLQVFSRVCQEALQEILNDNQDLLDWDLRNVPYTQLFYQLQGGGLVLPLATESARPLAGKLCIEWKPIVKKRFSSGLPLKPAIVAKREKEKEIEMAAEQIRDSLTRKGITLSEQDVQKLKNDLKKRLSEEKSIRDRENDNKILLRENQQISIDYRRKQNSLRNNQHWLDSYQKSLDRLTSRETVKQAFEEELEQVRSNLKRDLSDLISLNPKIGQSVKAILDTAEQMGREYAERQLYQLAEEAFQKDVEPLSPSTKYDISITHPLSWIINAYNQESKLRKRNIEQEFQDGTIQKQRSKFEVEIEKLRQSIKTDSIQLDSLKKNAEKNLKNLSDKKSFYYKINYVEIEFNEGFIEHIQVVGVLDNAIKPWAVGSRDDDSFEQKKNETYGEQSKLIFSNAWPLGFSRKHDFRRLRDITLIGSVEGHSNDQYELRLGDLLLEYEPALQVGRRDFSPENRVVRFDYDNKETCKKLYKEETYKLFEARVFTDLVGIDPDKPNGLVQTEISKRININTARSRKSFSWNYGWLAWFEPKITLSKIENNNKYLLLNRIDSVNTDKRLVATLDARERESFNVGATGNLLYFDLPNFKSNLMFNLGFRYGRTPVKIDTILTGINSLTIFPEVVMDIRGDERWGAMLSLQLNRMSILGRKFRQVSDVEDPENLLPSVITDNRWYNTSQVFFYFHPAKESSGRLFFRYRYNCQFGDMDLGFHQAQLGYSFYLLGQSKSEKK